LWVALGIIVAIILIGGLMRSRAVDTVDATDPSFGARRDDVARRDDIARRDDQIRRAG